jgi:hypothetical protein
VQDALSASWAVAQRQEGKSCIFALSGSRAITEAGVLFYATVYFNGNAAVNSRFTFTLGDLLLNEGSPVAKVRNGTLEIKELTFVGIETVETPFTAQATIVNGELRVSGDNIRSVRLFDLSGKIIVDLPFAFGNPPAVPVAHLPAGVYVAAVENGQGIISRNKIRKH